MPIRKPPRERASSHNVKLFARYGPWWMIAAMVVERFPFKTALTVVSTLLLWKLHGR